MSIKNNGTIVAMYVFCSLTSCSKVVLCTWKDKHSENGWFELSLHRPDLSVNLCVCEEDATSGLQNDNIIHYFIDEPHYQNHIDCVGWQEAQKSNDNLQSVAWEWTCCMGNINVYLSLIVFYSTAATVQSGID